MTILKYCTCETTAKLAGEKTELLMFTWDNDWHQFAAVAPVESQLTAANIRGAIRRNLRKYGYRVEIADDRLPRGCTQTGVIFRFGKIPVEQLPKQKPVPMREFVPPDETSQLEMQLA